MKIVTYAGLEDKTFPIKLTTFIGANTTNLTLVALAIANIVVHGYHQILKVSISEYISFSNEKVIGKISATTPPPNYEENQ